MIQFGPDVCGNVSLAVTGEWLETNGLGGFASSTISGLNTRRYHGLLIAAMKPPSGRLLLLSKLEEVLVIDGKRYELSSNQYPNLIHPQGYQFQKAFRLNPFPTLTYAIGGIELEKTVFMIHGENTTVIEYQIRPSEVILSNWPSSGPKKIVLEVHPLIAFRDYHSTTHQNNTLNPYVETREHLAMMRPYPGLPELNLAHDADSVEATGFWYRNFEYIVEHDRGLDYMEDLFNPLVLRFDLARCSSVAVIASTQPHDIQKVVRYRQTEISRRQAIISQAPVRDEFIQDLTAGADHFVVERDDKKTIVAGYHWFGDWGRDTMVALPGLTLISGRFDVARDILLHYARHEDGGMLPNYFNETDDRPQYNSADVSLWFFEAVELFTQYTGDFDFVRTYLYEAILNIIEWHVRGTRFGIQLDHDGLLSVEREGMPLTWMDAKVADWVVTPRYGKPVEIEALWYNALRIAEHLANHFGDSNHERRFAEMAEEAKKNFNKLFWNEVQGCLFDVVSQQTSDSSIRPNQIFAVSLTHSILPEERAKDVVVVVGQELLTPYGLRTLSVKDPKFRGRYEGNVMNRDGAYHQGTVWPWLMGPFIRAFVKVTGNTEKARQQAAQWLSNLYSHLSEAGLGQVSEIFDGNPPHHPRGCIAQAWSVAEILRAAVEEVYNLRPKDGKGIQLERNRRF